MLRVKEVFRTLQGEGSRAGQPAVFVRFTGCNLWSGLEAGRATGRGACAQWCDTDFAHGEPWAPDLLAEHVRELARGMLRPLVVLTGGEPTLQLGTHSGAAFVRHLRSYEIDMALETNGTVVLPSTLVQAVRHVTVSPKPLLVDGAPSAGMGHVAVRAGTDLKVVVPTPFSDADLVKLSAGFVHCYAQPMDDGTGPTTNLPMATALAERLGWRVSAQTHKLLGLR